MRRSPEVIGWSARGYAKGDTGIRTEVGDIVTENSDFDALDYSGVRDNGGGVRVGILGDGSAVIVRPSSDG
jgi:hypothetical protein